MGGAKKVSGIQKGGAKKVLHGLVGGAKKVLRPKMKKNIAYFKRSQHKIQIFFRSLRSQYITQSIVTILLSIQKHAYTMYNYKLQPYIHREHEIHVIM